MNKDRTANGSERGDRGFTPREPVFKKLITGEPILVEKKGGQVHQITEAEYNEMRYLLLVLTDEVLTLKRMLGCVQMTALNAELYAMVTRYKAAYDDGEATDCVYKHVRKLLREIWKRRFEECQLPFNLSFGSNADLVVDWEEDGDDDDE